MFGTRVLRSTISAIRQKINLNDLVFRSHRFLSSSPIRYEIIFVTGDERGAATDANIHASLIGEHNELAVPIDNSQLQITRNSEETIVFSTDSYDIGPIKGVRVGHDATGSGSGWFLEKVVLHISGAPDDSSMDSVCSINKSANDLCSATTDSITKVITHEFPFYGWLGKSNSGGHDGPLAAEITPLPISQWPDNNVVTPEELKAIFDDAASHPIALRLAGYSIPHPDKVTEGVRAVCGKNFGYGGEDSYFTHPHGFLGVADGVYSWRSAGVDSGLYSRALMKGALDRAVKASLDGDAVTPMDLFHAAVAEANKAQTQGSSTACIFGLVPLSLLAEVKSSPNSFNHSVHLGATIGQCVNLGDSGVIICRPSEGKVLFRTKHQEHEFGYPYQLGHESSDSADDVQISFVGGLKEGDVVVCGTDGLFDNVSDGDILDIILKNPSKSNGAQALALELIRTAHANSMSSVTDTPYSIAATGEYELPFHGGKQDDITCVVAYLVDVN